MKLFTAMITTVALLAPASTNAQTLVITRGGSRTASPAPAENFTGGVRVEALFEALDPSHASGGSVTFEPGARTAWHSHPRGQILVVTAGTGRVQRWGDPIEEIRQGDVVGIPAGQKSAFARTHFPASYGETSPKRPKGREGGHWHGASPQESMTHIAITEHRDGIRVRWLEKVSDAQYNAAPSRQGQASSPNPRASSKGTAGASGALQH